VRKKPAEVFTPRDNPAANSLGGGAVCTWPGGLTGAGETMQTSFRSEIID
jgi:hypothetical protein